MTPERWQRAQEVFDSAVKRTPEARAAYLDGACGNDLEMRREVESLLASHDSQSEGFLEKPAIEEVATGTSLISGRKLLTRGSRLGSFEIIGPLGAGGMGEVYRAKDPRLGRDVAIKVLPLQVASDKDRLKRFEKEARSASALNHPNIVTIYETGTSDGLPWIAMEHIEGETLRTLVTAGSLPIRKLLGISVQVAEGLARAHEAGIVHRDLKPENVMVTKDGLVKILDFGLAKLQGPVSGGSDKESQLPTITGTSPGIVLGTAGYMSPEQASGKVVDFRSDQFAFGSILYELATGRRAFLKKTAVETLTAILNEEPAPIASINAQTPAPLRWIVERCLSKEPDGRYVSTRDLARELATVQGHLSEATSGRVEAVSAARFSKRWRLVIPALAVALLAAGAIGFRWWSGRSSPSLPIFTQLTFRRGNLTSSRFAPDGRTVAYTAAWDGNSEEVFTVRTDSVASTAIGLKGAVVQSVSSKGELAVTIDGTLARVPLAGGSPRQLLEKVLAADWAPNGEDLAVVRRMGNNYRVEYPIGKVLYESPIPIVYSCRVSPNGEFVAFFERGSILTVDRKGKRRIVSSGWEQYRYLAWSPRGDEIVLTGGRPDTNAWAAYAVSLSGRIRVIMSNAFRLFLHDVAPDGRLLVEDDREHTAIAFLSRGETRERDLGWQNEPTLRKITRDGKGIVYESNGAIYFQKTDGSPAVRLGSGVFQDLSADERSIILLEREPAPHLVLMPIGPGENRTIPIEGFSPISADVLPKNGGYLLSAFGKSGDPVFAVLSLEGGKARMLPELACDSSKNAIISPDGSHFACQSKDGRVVNFSLSGGAAATVPGEPLARTEQLLGWSEEERTVFVSQVVTSVVPLQVDRLDLFSGHREPWKSIAPEDPRSVTQINHALISPDGQSYAYDYNRAVVDDLFVINGLK